MENDVSVEANGPTSGNDHQKSYHEKVFTVMSSEFLDDIYNSQFVQACLVFIARQALRAYLENPKKITLDPLKEPW